MPETPLTREQLLTSAHILRPGDVLVLRIPTDTSAREADDLATQLRDRLPAGISALVVSDRYAIEVVRPDDKAGTIPEAFARAHAHPGTFVEVDPGPDA